MTFPAIVAALVLTVPQDPTPFTQRQGVAEPSRLALTPVIDGALRADEWDLFAQGESGEVFLQWEPGRLYIAGRMPEDRELVFSLDNRQDGWLVGKDNFEFRVRLMDGRATMIARQLDATAVSGPKWIPLPAFEKAAILAGTAEKGEAQLEAAIVDPGLGVLAIRDQERYSVRLDVVSQAAQAADPFYPRIGTLVKLTTQRASAMPIDLDWKVEDPGRSVTRGKSTKMRFSFSSKKDPGIKKIEIKPMGPLAEHATIVSEPFPAFDRKGRTYVDYEAKTDRMAPTGYHLVNTTIFTADGSPALIQASVRVTSLVEFKLEDKNLDLASGAADVKIPFFIKSNSVNRIDGFFEVEGPNGWEILKGNDKGFVIYNSRAGVRRVLTVRIPATARGPMPIRFKATIGQHIVEEMCWLTIDRT